MNSSILSLLIFLPVLGAVAMLIVALLINKGILNSDKNIYKYIALGVTGVQLFFAVLLYINFDPSLSVTQ